MYGSSFIAHLHFLCLRVATSDKLQFVVNYKNEYPLRENKCYLYICTCSLINPAQTHFQNSCKYFHSKQMYKEKANSKILGIKSHVLILLHDMMYKYMFDILSNRLTLSSIVLKTLI